MQDFIEALNALCVDHGILLDGELRILPMARFIKNSQKIVGSSELMRGLIRDTNGPFLRFSAIEVASDPIKFDKNVKITIQDKDALLKDGVKSPADGKHYGNSREWKDHLRKNGLVEFGNEPIKERKLQGDFNCREALGRATSEVFEKHGLK